MSWYDTMKDEILAQFQEKRHVLPTEKSTKMYFFYISGILGPFSEELRREWEWGDGWIVGVMNRVWG
jgi:hypothetical protein